MCYFRVWWDTLKTRCMPLFSEISYLVQQVGPVDRKNVMLYKESDHYDSVVRRKIYVRQRDLVLKEHDTSPYKTEEVRTESIIAQDGDIMPSSGGKIRPDHIDHSTTSPVESVNTWGRDEMNNISQTTFSNVFSSMKMFEFRLKFHWSLFPRVQLTIFQHWFR